MITVAFLICPFKGGKALGSIMLKLEIPVLDDEPEDIPFEARILFSASPDISPALFGVHITIKACEKEMCSIYRHWR